MEKCPKKQIFDYHFEKFVVDFSLKTDKGAHEQRTQTAEI